MLAVVEKYLIQLQFLNILSHYQIDEPSFLEFLGFFLAINFIWFNETAAKDFNEIQKFYINRASYCHFK